MATDPICQVEVDEPTATFRGFTHEMNGTKYCFCSARCQEVFQDHPAPYTMVDAENRATSEGMPPAPAD